VIGQAINMSRTPFEMRWAAPEQEHIETVLKEFGYDPSAIADFRKTRRDLAARAGDQATISKHISETTRSRSVPGGGMR
jgi:hypothetical protein